MKTFLKYFLAGLVGFILASVLWIYLGVRDVNQQMVERELVAADDTLAKLRLLREGKVDTCIGALERDLDEHIRRSFRKNVEDGDFSGVESQFMDNPLYVRETVDELYDYRRQYPHPLPKDLTTVDGSPYPKEMRKFIDADAILKKAHGATLKIKDVEAEGR